MGLIKAAMGAADGVMADQWKEFLYCDSLDKDTLAAKGQKRTSSRGRSSNTSGEDNIITKGSVIVVNEGQCMMIVEQGKVVEICAEPGEYIYDSSTEPTVFGGDLASDLKAVFRNMGKRFTFGGDAPKDQRVYYFNTKEIMGNKYGTPQSIQFETMIGPYMLNVNIRCFGEYSYRIANPILFYTNVCSNIDTVYERSEIDSQLKSELLTALQPAFGRIAAKGIRYTQLINYTKDIRNELSEELSEDWGKKRGIEIVSFGVSSVKAEEEDERRIKEIQDSAIMSNPDMRAGRLATATADAMRTAAGNEAGMGGAFGFMGMGMAGQMGAGAMGALAKGPHRREIPWRHRHSSHRHLSKQRRPRRSLVGPARAVTRAMRASSARSVASRSQNPPLMAGPAAAARSTRASSAWSAARRSRRASRSTAATSAAGSRRTRSIRRSSAPSAAIRSMRATDSEVDHLDMH